MTQELFELVSEGEVNLLRVLEADISDPMQKNRVDAGNVMLSDMQDMDSCSCCRTASGRLTHRVAMRVGCGVEGGMKRCSILLPSDLYYRYQNISTFSVFTIIKKNLSIQIFQKPF